MAFFFLLAVLVLLPFELPIAEGIHGTMSGLMGEGYPFFFVGSLSLAASLFLLVVSWRSRKLLSDLAVKEYCVFGSIFVSIGVYALVNTLVRGGEVELAVRQLIFGYVAPVAVCLCILREDRKRRQTAWLALYSGWVLFLLVSLFFLRSAWREAMVEDQAFATATFSQRVLLWRFTFVEQWNLYSVYMGNANKMSNYLVIFLMVSRRLLGLDAVDTTRMARIVFWLFWCLGVFTLVMMFSRAAVLLFPIVFLVSGVWRLMSRKMWYVLVASAGLSVPIMHSSYSEILGYLFEAKLIDDDAAPMIGTLESRFEQWGEIGQLLKDHPEVLYWGLGTGEYGTEFGEGPDSGTHNMFLDVLVESGILGLLLLVTLMVLMMLKGVGFPRLKSWDVLCLTTTVVLVLLMMREHSVSYLYATSMGGFCFALIFFLQSEPAKGSGNLSGLDGRVPMRG